MHCYDLPGGVDHHGGLADNIAGIADHEPNFMWKTDSEALVALLG